METKQLEQVTSDVRAIFAQIHGISLDDVKDTMQAGDKRQKIEGELFFRMHYGLLVSHSDTVCTLARKILSERDCDREADEEC